MVNRVVILISIILVQNVLRIKTDTGGLRLKKNKLFFAKSGSGSRLWNLSTSA